MNHSSPSLSEQTIQILLTCTLALNNTMDWEKFTVKLFSWLRPTLKI